VTHNAVREALASASFYSGADKVSEFTPHQIDLIMKVLAPHLLPDGAVAVCKHHLDWDCQDNHKYGAQQYEGCEVSDCPLKPQPEAKP